MTILDFYKRKRESTPITMVTSYDSWSAALIADSDVDCILVGDSLAMVMHGHSSTIPATVELMAAHTAAVRRGAPDAFIIGDMPFLSVRKGLTAAMEAVEAIMRAGASAVKLEGAAGQLDIISHIIESGVPVMGHLGLTPQSLHQFGGFKPQGRREDGARRIADDARALQEAGCFALVLECVPLTLAEEISESLNIPVIGIGAGAGVDGQVLVFQDLMGLGQDFSPRFVRRYLEGFDLMKDALNRFVADVGGGAFPDEKESYS